MSEDSDIKLSFLPAQARIRLVLTKAACDRSPTPPEELYQRAVKRLEQGVADKSLAFYNLYRDRLELVWRRMRLKKFKPDKQIAVTLAAGAPPMPEIVVTPGPAPFLASLSINASVEKIGTWKFEFLKLTVQKRLKDMNLAAHPDSAMLQAIFLRAKRGKRVIKVPINSAPQIEAGQDDFSVMPRGMSGDLVLVINNIASIATEAARATIMGWLSNYVESASQRGSKNYEFLKDDVEARLKSFLRGPERLSIDLPATILAAIAEPKASEKPNQPSQADDRFYSTPAQTNQTSTATATTPAKKQEKDDFDGNRFFKVQVDDQKMTATLSIISDRAYSEASKVTGERIEAFLATKGVVFGIKLEAVEALRTALTNNGETKSFGIAQGIWPVTPEEPYLHASYKHKAAAEEGSMRDRRSGGFVKKGDVVAEIAFKKPGQHGTDVYGNKIPMKTPELPQVTCGNHIQEKDRTTFTATKDGIPQLTDNSVAIEPAYVHEGNVNLTSGNIDFDGPVVITGNIEHGAMVIAAGDLEVQGVIEECVIKCGGNLTAAGILSGPKGMVRVRGDAVVAFASNGNMEVKGNLTVNGNLTNTNVLAGKTITVAGTDSLVIGGTIEFGEKFVCLNLGRTSGQMTRVVGGANPFEARRVANLTKRVGRLQALKDEMKKGSRHLSSLKAASTTKKHAARRDDLKIALTHIAELITKVEDQLSRAQTHLTQADGARIEVVGTLSQNCRITMGGKNIVPPEDVASVAVISKRIKGSFIVALDESASGSGSDSKQSA